MKFFKYCGLFFSMQPDPLYSFKVDLISVAGCLFPVALLHVSQQLQIINKVGLSFTGMNINYQCGLCNSSYFAQCLFNGVLMLYGNSPGGAFVSSGDPPLMKLSDDTGEGLSSDPQPAAVVSIM